MESQLNQWLAKKVRNYEAGVAIFAALGGNKTELRYFQNTKAKFAMRKLEHALMKMAKSMPQQEVVAPSLNVITSDVRHVSPGTTTIVDIPDVAKIAKKLVHDTWTDMARLTEDLYNVGTSNDEASMNARKFLLKERVPLIVRYNELYEAKEAFFSGEISEADLQSVIDGKQEHEANETEDYGCLSDLELTKKIKATKQSINRCSNQLKYQQDTVGKVENQMPECPRREKLVNALACRQKSLDALLKLYKERGLDGNA